MEHSKQVLVLGAVALLANIGAYCLFSYLSGKRPKRQGKKLFSFGLVTDIQYADKDTQKGRYFREAADKLKTCIDTWNKEELALTINVGDIIDGNTPDQKTDADFEHIMQIFSQSRHRNIHVIGNHCLFLPGPKERLVDKLKLEKRYFVGYHNHGTQIVILDGTDVGLQSHPPGTPEYAVAKEIFETLKKDGAPNAFDWNAAVGLDQLGWLSQTLKKARADHEKVLVFCHYPILEEAASDKHLLWNWKELLDLINSYNDVVPFYCAGHYHQGGYYYSNGIHHLTLEAVVEAPNDSNAFAIVDVYKNKIKIRGYGMVKSQTFKF